MFEDKGQRLVHRNARLFGETEQGPVRVIGHGHGETNG